MNYEKLTVGQMADINHVSRQTLRHYDREGLLLPATVDPETGYRYYHIKQSARLDMIQYMKSLGISLREIKEHLDGGNFPEIITLLEQKDSQLDRQITELRYQKRAISRTIESIRRYNAAPPDGTVVLEYIDQRQIYCFDSRINFYEGGIEIYEQMLRQLKDQIRSRHLPEIYFWNAGTILRREHLLSRVFYSSEVFVLVDRDYVDPALLTTIPASTWLCIYCDRFHKEKEYALQLMDTIEEQGYRVTGDYICEVIYEPPVPNSLDRAMYLRLQVPISFR